ncbi:MAG TPA: hypothetical protein VH251_08985 [Verrucomicrobiae bacterium]|jgi:hypothetical protein|nr:hypothetical protein [Verrucomicrobiae bacterium]
MNHRLPPLINTRLQPGGEDAEIVQPFQQLAVRGKTVETVLRFVCCCTGLKPGVNGMRYPRFGNYYL